MEQSKPKKKGKGGRPTHKQRDARLGTKDPFAIIDRLIADKQPWVLMRYPFKMKLSREFTGVCYELVIWQTCEDDYSHATLEVTKEQAHDIIDRYELTERKRYKEENAVIWARNDNFQELRRGYHRGIDEIMANAAAASKLFDALKAAKFMLDKEEYNQLRERAEKAEREALDSLVPFKEEYIKKHHIIIYQLY